MIHDGRQGAGWPDWAGTGDGQVVGRGSRHRGCFDARARCPDRGGALQWCWKGADRKMAEVSLEASLRQQERVLEELRLVRSDIGDFRADMEVQSAIVRRLDQSVQSLTGEVRALAAQQDRQRQRLERLQGLLAPTSGEPA